MDRSQATSANLMDTHNRLIADILTHYRTLMMLATIQAEGERSNSNPETISVAGISMEMAFDGLYSSIKELLALSRRIKELWVFGPLNQSDTQSQEKEEQIDRDVTEVANLLDMIDANAMKKLAERCGGTWELQETTTEAAPTAGS
ncbi:hypothetical protein CDV36_001394 [Fusarium kuroshium]|uniref:Mediator of RNA polymerase II transcription subunit 22 n=2 Tax=Fusarium solani species complex TaxID=232080 RepID=A0A3M2SMX3_9HYPO|nr:hypothetical protein CDV36_001394 [Fusarium kuroshium]RSL48329.1 hypothetical protein CEP53_009576 [Fusarium sp. AF-6]RSM13191.1 hypothetical protein CEP52_002083 [Fusarium oligoseptatum]